MKIDFQWFRSLFGLPSKEVKREQQRREVDAIIAERRGLGRPRPIHVRPPAPVRSPLDLERDAIIALGGMAENNDRAAGLAMELNRGRMRNTPDEMYPTSAHRRPLGHIEGELNENQLRRLREQQGRAERQQRIADADAAEGSSFAMPSYVEPVEGYAAGYPRSAPVPDSFRDDDGGRHAAPEDTGRHHIADVPAAPAPEPYSPPPAAPTGTDNSQSAGNTDNTSYSGGE